MLAAFWIVCVRCSIADLREDMFVISFVVRFSSM